MNYEELDATTRKWMLDEFKKELGGAPFRPKVLSDLGWGQFPQIMEEAIKSGDDVTLAQALDRPAFFQDRTRRTKTGTARVRTNPAAASKMLALTEFNTWYVRGLCRRLIEESVKTCEVYRAEPALVPRCECTAWEHGTFPVVDVYNGHRARYHGAGQDRRAFSVPSGPNCHHSIRRAS